MRANVATPDPIRQETINKVLWSACDTFRGIINAKAYKHFSLFLYS